MKVQLRDNIKTLFFLFTVMMLLPTANAATYYVSPTGNNANPGTLASPKADFSWFTSSIPAAGDTVYLRGGTYTDKHMVIKSSGNAGNPIIITNYPGETPILNGVDQTGYGIIAGGISTNFRVNYVNISGITIHDYGNGILVREATNVHISNVNVYNIAGVDDGVFFLDSSYSSIKDSIVRDIGWNAIGVQVNYKSVHHIDIINNEVYGGINAGHNLIDLNNNGAGSAANEYTHDINIIGNRLHDTIGGNSAIFEHGTDVLHHDRITITDNIAYNTNALQVGYLKDSVVKNNVVYSSTYGLESQASVPIENVIFTCNKVYSNQVNTYLAVKPGKSITMVNDNIPDYRITQGNALIIDPQPERYTIRADGGRITIRYTDGGPYTVNGVTKTGDYTTSSSGVVERVYKQGGMPATCTTAPIEPVLAKITVSPSPVLLPLGSTQQFTAYTEDQSGNPISAMITWTSSNTTVGTISLSSGLFTALAAGTTIITASSDSISGTATATVVDTPVLTSIFVTPQSATTTIGSSIQFTAHPKDQFGNDISAAITWSSSDLAVGTIAQDGLFSALTLGTSTITASSGNIAGTATAHVKDPENCIPCALCKRFEKWKIVCTMINEFCTSNNRPGSFCTGQKQLCESKVDSLIAKCHEMSCEGTCASAA